MKRHALCQRILLAAACLSLALGCAAKLSGPERARLVGQESSRQYMLLHQEYAELHAGLPDSSRAWLRRNIAPILDRLKRSIILYNQAAIAWSVQGAPGRDMDALLADIAELLRKAGLLLKEAPRE